MKYLLRLLKYARPYWKCLVISAFSLFAVTGLNLVGPWLIKTLVGLVTALNAAPETPKAILRLSLILFFSYLARMGFQFLHGSLSHRAAWSTVAQIRAVLYDKLQHLSLGYLSEQSTGQLMSRVLNDTATFEMLIAHALPDLFTNLTILAGVTLILFRMNATLAFFTLIPIPFLIYACVLFTRHVLPLFRKAQAYLAEFSADLQDNLSGIKEIQAFNKQEKEERRIRAGSFKSAQARINAMRLSSLFHPAVNFFSSLGSVIVVAFGGFLALRGQIPVEDIVGFILYLNLFYQPITALGLVLENIQNAMVGAERVFAILDTETEITEAPDAIVLPRVKGEIEFRNVYFSYRRGTKILEGVSFRIEPGQMVALVGPTGVGKTTILSLLNRFYDPDAGSVLIDGVPVNQVTLRSLRDNISMVLQDVFLFNGTVAENIAYGKEGASQAEIEAAARIACAHEFITAMPDGYDTYIGERGVKLSGGQKQRLAIARAVLKDAPILVLDEATSAVDVETEGEIQRAIDHLAGTRTIIIIAHRLSTVKKADQIIVLDEGKIVQKGTHKELLKQPGLYRYLCALQFSQGEEETRLADSGGQ